MSAPQPPQFLTLEQVITRLCAGEPIIWVTVRDDETGTIADMALNGRPAQYPQRGSAS
jgi:hypothetical protein